MATLMEMGQTLAESGFLWVSEFGFGLVYMSMVIYRVKSGDYGVIEDAKDLFGQFIAYTGISYHAIQYYFNGVDWKFAITATLTAIGLYLTFRSVKTKKEFNDIKREELKEQRLSRELKERELNHKLEESNK